MPPDGGICIFCLGNLLNVNNKKNGFWRQILPYPLFVLFSIIAFNITAFTVVLQMGILIFNSTILKIIAWIFTISSWTVVYIFRNK